MHSGLSAVLELCEPAGGRCLRARAADWADLPDEQLLDLRLADLPLTARGHRLESRASRSCAPSSNARELRFPIHFYISDEWFTPDGTATMAVPFYLTHPRLERLEKAQMLEVEGGDHEWCMRILRHEAGHVIDNVYKLRLRRQRRQLFGSSSRAVSRVLRAQAVQQELRPAHRSLVRAEPSGRGLRRDVCGVADAGIELEAALRGVAGAGEARIHGRADAHRCAARSRWSTTSKRSIRCGGSRHTLRRHYRRKRRHHGIEHPKFYDRELRRLFSDAPEFAGNMTAAQFLGKIRRPVRRVVADWTGIYQYTIDKVLEDMITRCRELKLRLAVPEEQARYEFTVLLTVQTMNYLHSGRHRVALVT